jgi:hypothetical protein
MIEAACACEGIGQSRRVGDGHLCLLNVQRLWRLSKQMFRLVGGAGSKFKILLFNLLKSLYPAPSNKLISLNNT